MKQKEKEFEKEILAEIQKIREKVTSKVLPDLICSKFCEQMLDGEFNEEETFKEYLQKLLRYLEVYQKAKIPRDFKPIKDRINDRREKAVNFVKDLPETILRAINPKGILKDVPERFSKTFQSKPLPKNTSSNPQCISFNTNKKNCFVMGEEGTLVEMEMQTGKELRKMEFKTDFGQCGVTCPTADTRTFSVFTNPSRIEVGLDHGRI